MIVIYVQHVVYDVGLSNTSIAMAFRREAYHITLPKLDLEQHEQVLPSFLPFSPSSRRRRREGVAS